MQLYEKIPSFWFFFFCFFFFCSSEQHTNDPTAAVEYQTLAYIYHSKHLFLLKNILKVVALIKALDYFELLMSRFQCASVSVRVKGLRTVEYFLVKSKKTPDRLKAAKSLWLIHWMCFTAYLKMFFYEIKCP